MALEAIDIFQRDKKCACIEKEKKIFSTVQKTPGVPLSQTRSGEEKFYDVSVRPF